MQAYLNDPSLKRLLLREIRAHRAADRLVRGSYGTNGSGQFRGCAVGCSIESLNRLTGTKYSTNNHSCYEPGFGVPIILARLQDSLFESLPRNKYLDWPERFWNAVPVGGDLAMVWPRFARWLLIDPVDGVIRFTKTDKTKAAIQRVGDVYQRWIAGDKPTRNEWISAAAAATAAASASASSDAADAAAASASASSASDAAYAAAAYAAYASASAAARSKQAEKLIELIEDCKPEPK